MTEYAKIRYIEESTGVPEDVTWEIFQGTTRDYTITVTLDGVNEDLTGGTLWFTVKSNYSDADNAAQLQLTSADSAEIEILNQVNYKGKAIIKITATQSEAISAGSYLFDVQYADSNGRVSTLINGDFVVKNNVTRTKS
jgi:hypothetical protein